jgi:hypothetical protein
MIPLFERDGFIICFEAEPEDTSMRHHFIKECGWSEKDYRKITDLAWFRAKVSAWRDGKELGTAYLGCCCYKTSEEFYTKYKDDYFADMVAEALAEAKGRT